MLACHHRGLYHFRLILENFCQGCSSSACHRLSFLEGRIVDTYKSEGKLEGFSSSVSDRNICACFYEACLSALPGFTSIFTPCGVL